MAGGGGHSHFCIKTPLSNARTRAIQKTTILTPSRHPCPDRSCLLPSAYRHWPLATDHCQIPRNFPLPVVFIVTDAADRHYVPRLGAGEA
jgi:hypothetical protein